MLELVLLLATCTGFFLLCWTVGWSLDRKLGYLSNATLLMWWSEILCEGTAAFTLLVFVMWMISLTN